MILAFKCPIGGVGAPRPILDSYTSSYNHIFIWNTSKLHFLYPTKLVECEYVKKNVKKISQYFSEKKKTYFFGFGAPMPIVEPYISSCNHIFDQNVTKLNFLYPTKHSRYYYVWIFFKQSPHPFLKEKRTLFFDTEALLPNQRPMMAITNNFPTNLMDFGHIFIWITLK